MTRRTPETWCQPEDVRKPAMRSRRKSYSITELLAIAGIVVMVTIMCAGLVMALRHDLRVNEAIRAAEAAKDRVDEQRLVDDEVCP